MLEEMNPRTASLMEAARELLHISKCLENKNRFEHRRGVQGALTALLHANTFPLPQLKPDELEAIRAVTSEPFARSSPELRGVYTRAV